MDMSGLPRQFDMVVPDGSPVHSQTARIMFANVLVPVQLLVIMEPFIRIARQAQGIECDEPDEALQCLMDKLGPQVAAQDAEDSQPLLPDPGDTHQPGKAPPQI